MNIEFNINNYVSFELTERGAGIINGKNETSNALHKAINMKADYKAGDIYRGQLWSVIDKFGGFSALGLESFCKNCILTFEVND